MKNFAKLGVLRQVLITDFYKKGVVFEYAPVFHSDIIIPEKTLELNNFLSNNEVPETVILNIIQEIFAYVKTNGPTKVLQEIEHKLNQMGHINLCNLKIVALLFTQNKHMIKDVLNEINESHHMPNYTTLCLAVRSCLTVNILINLDA
jgi:uncharacterized membrane protein